MLTFQSILRPVPGGTAWEARSVRRVESEKPKSMMCQVHRVRADMLFEQGFDADHPDIDLLRLRNFTIGRKLTQEELTNDGLERVADLFACMKPFVSGIHSCWLEINPLPFHSLSY